MVFHAVADAPDAQAAPNQYRGVVVTLLVTAIAGFMAGVVTGILLGNPVVLEMAVTLLIATGVLVGVVMSRPGLRRREQDLFQSGSSGEDHDAQRASAVEPLSEPPDLPVRQSFPQSSAAGHAGSDLADRFAGTPARERATDWRALIRRYVRVATAATSAVAIVSVWLFGVMPVPLEPLTAALAACACLAAAGLAATAVRYLADIANPTFPESHALAQAARIVAWIAGLAGASIGLQWAGQQAAIRVLSGIATIINVALCSGLLAVEDEVHEPATAFPLDIGALSVLGARGNVVGSMLDAAERQLGIDLRSTWALTVVRRSLEPLVIALCFVGWLSTSLTIVGVEEQGLVERFGVPSGAAPLEPGLHLHWPWPIDHVFGVPVRRVQALTVGHEGQEEGGPEDVLWARQHAANEYTLLLGNGRDLITVDAAVQFRIADARAWQYHSQNPEDALRAIAYRAVMRTTVNRTLTEALSENVVTTTARMRAMVQREADALGLGVEVLGFTVGGMHPPVMVSTDYQAVVSAELRKVTAVVDAEAFRHRTVPSAQGGVLAANNAAIAEAAQARARAVGDAWSFLALQSQYAASPSEYVFRRRLETLEQWLPKRRFTILDFRFQRDGGELWVTP
ncbi:MAG TPA: SPFH domain-containing protein [Vicinamibacterales bacterium]